MTPRAAAMSAQDRRATLVAATLPLLRASGAAVTTKEIAAAAGVSEGTIFRVFDTKDDLVHACIGSAFDTDQVCAQLAAIDRSQPLADRLTAGVEVMRSHVEGIVALMSVLHATGVSMAGARGLKGAGMRRSAPEVDALFLDLIGPDAVRLRYPAERVVTFLSMLTLASAHPMLPYHGATAADVVDLLLNGAYSTESESS